MKWQDKGYLLSINKYNENSAIAEFFTENNGKVSGVIFGATSKKIKNYLLMGNKFHLNFNFKQDSKLGYFKIEIDKATTPNYLENKKKLFCIIYTMNLIKTLTVDNETNTTNTSPITLASDILQEMEHVSTSDASGSKQMLTQHTGMIKKWNMPKRQLTDTRASKSSSGPRFSTPRNNFARCI